MIEINWIAVLVATVVNFFIGFLWYTPLFGKAWAKELGITMTGPPPAGLLVRGLAIGVIGNFFMAYVLAHNNVAWSFVPGMSEMSTAEVILSAGIFTWLGFYLPVDLNRVAWENASWKLFFINTTYHLALTLSASTILTLM